MTLDQIAIAYVKLVLAVGKHSPDYVDAYIGPDAWRDTCPPSPLTDLLAQADQLLTQTLALPAPLPDQENRLEFFKLLLRACRGYIAQLNGEKFAFDAESRVLYDAVSPALTATDLDATLAELQQLLPGNGDINSRLNAYQREFEIPRDKLDAVFSAAIHAARARTRQHIALPENENFRVEYVSNQVWSAYNWYKGDHYSVIQVNTDFPMYISRAIDLACHEAYPGHHVMNLLIEKELVREKAWMEYAVYPLFSPLSFLAEGSANYGIEVVFPHAERMAFEQEVLFPLAGIAPEKAERYYQIEHVLQKLSYADNLVGKAYLDGAIDHDAAIAMLMKYRLSNAERSAQRLRFIERLRSYVINYNLGQDVVQAYIEGRAGKSDQQQRWQVLTDLLRQPKSASMMLG